MNESPLKCRVCGEATKPFFTKRLMHKYEVPFERCSACGHIQTIPPYWLEEAYAKLSFQRDVGMVGRSIGTAKLTVALAHKLRIPPNAPALDWGAGTGMFVRLCRDYGLNFFYSDRYAKNIFAQGFEATAFETGGHELITAFEVAEHFPDPVVNFAEILRLKPRYFLFSTLLYQDQGPDWWYFSEDGQHVALYTRKSLAVIAKSHGYHLATDDCGTHLFSREPVSDRLINRMLRKRDQWSERYKKRHGSRLLPDFDHITRLLAQRDIGK